jgi:hypothetical protein
MVVSKARLSINPEVEESGHRERSASVEKVVRKSTFGLEVIPKVALAAVCKLSFCGHVYRAMRYRNDS